MRYLLSSLLVIAFVSCASYPKKNNFQTTESTQNSIENNYFSDEAKDYVYKANINAFGKAFGGIFIVKKLGTANHRMAFTTELGNKIFDFTFKEDDFIINHILKEMDRQVLINILKNDFRVLVAENPSVERTFSKKEVIVHQTKILGKKYFYFQKDEHLYKITKVRKGNEKVEFLFSQINDSLLKNIRILHRNISLEIVLTLL